MPSRAATSKSGQELCPCPPSPTKKLPDSRQLSLVAPRHLGDRHRLVVAGVSGLAELRHAQRHHVLHGFACRLQIVTWIELLRSLGKYLADRAGIARRLSVSTLILRTPL